MATYRPFILRDGSSGSDWSAGQIISTDFCRAIAQKKIDTYNLPSRSIAPSRCMNRLNGTIFLSHLTNCNVFSEGTADAYGEEVRSTEEGQQTRELYEEKGEEGSSSRSEEETVVRASVRVSVGADKRPSCGRSVILKPLPGAIVKCHLEISIHCAD